MVDIYKIRRFMDSYMKEYPEISISFTYDECNFVAKWEFHAYSSGKYAMTHGDCISQNTDNVLSVIKDSFLRFLSTDVVKYILSQSRLEEL